VNTAICITSSKSVTLQNKKTDAMQDDKNLSEIQIEDQHIIDNKELNLL
jgi:hypothetical protein